MRLKQVNRVLAIVAAAALLAACGKKEEAAAPGAAAPMPVVKIGHVGPVSGPIAHLGKDNELGARMAIDELNAAGVNIGGQQVKLELLAEDDGAEAVADTDNVGDPSVEINVEELIHELEVDGITRPGREQAAKRRLEELMEQKRAKRELEDFEDYEI